MAILFTDGVKGLKYGCPEATKYLSEDSQYHHFFSVSFFLSRNELTWQK